MSPHTKGKEQAPVTLTQQAWGGGGEGKKMAERTQHEGKTERAK